MLSSRLLLSLTIIVAACSLAFSQTTPERQRNYPAPVEGDYTIKDFKFRSGDTLPQLKLHYFTIGIPAKDDGGVTRNVVLIMHGTGGTGAQFLSAHFANILFGPGQLLDATKYFIRPAGKLGTEKQQIDASLERFGLTASYASGTSG